MAARLTKKEKGFVKDYLKTGNGTKAALANYNTKSENTAAVIASENIRKPHIRNLLAEVLTDELLAEKHLELLNKTDLSGEIDVQAVSKGLDMAYKLKGSYAPEKQVTLDLVVDMTDKKKVNQLFNGETEQGTN